MTELLEQAIRQLKTLDTKKQNAIASMILEEIEDKAKWDAQFNRSQDLLADLATEAMQEYHTGETKLKIDRDLYNP